jgi:single-stranded-DNA-specific exonuclease
VIGIVASRVVERIHRPTILISLDEASGRGRGSGRSIRPFHLYDGLATCAELLERFGGHRQAAGLEVRTDRIEAFREAFNAHARAVLTPDDLVAEVDIDLEVTLPEANQELYDLLEHFAPFGLGNPAPVIAARGVRLASAPRVVGDAHLKLDLTDGGARLGAIGFRMGELQGELGGAGARVDAAFQLQENTWNGRTELQARLVDIRSAP